MTVGTLVDRERRQLRRAEWIAAALFALGVAGGFLFDEAAVALLLAAAYVVPGWIRLAHGGFQAGYGALWIAALLGVFAARTLRGGWAIGPRWKTPLVLWAATVALTWPIVALRELDFSPRLIHDYGLANSVIGYPAPLAAGWVAGVAAITGLGLLWFNWLALAFARAGDRFRTVVLAPILISGALSVGVGLYQMAGHILFLNDTVFGAMNRAAGLMYDGNSFGLIAALWGPMTVAFFIRSPRAAPLAWIAYAASWTATWASGSRTALAAAVIGAVPLVRIALARGATLSRRRVAVASTAAAVALVVLLTALPVAGPLRRMQASLPSANAASLSAFVDELWNRNGYGLAAVQMIREHPWTGLGVGSFHVIVADYSYLVKFHWYLIPDNAQNWYRHQLAELGLLGSVGWIAWAALFAVALWRHRAPATARAEASIVRGLLIAIGLISLLGMPAQDVAVAITFWTLAFWYVSITDGVGDSRRPVVGPWVAAVVLIVLVGGTIVSARGSLRAPNRAVRAGRDYSYGFYAPEPAPDGGLRRWASGHGVIVIPTAGPRMKLTVSINHRDISLRPVDVLVRVDGSTAFQDRVTTVEPRTVYVNVPGAGKRVLLETWASRTVRPSDFGSADSRDLGVLLEWRFTDQPAPAPNAPAR